MVTVSSAQPSAPKSIFALSQCNADSDGFLTVGCMTRGFSPADSLTFKWKAPGDKELNSFVQYPAFGSDGAYTKISHLRVKKSDWNPETHYTCEASNSIGRLEVIFGPPAPPPELPATVYLTVPTKKELDNGTATFICLAQQFSPKAYKFKWFQDGQEVTKPTGDIDTYDTSEKKGSVTEYSATSIFKISADTWMNTDTTVKCVFEHKAGNKEREAKYTAPDCSNIDVVIDPPSLEDMLKNRKGMLMCKAKGESQGFTKIEIKANNYVIAEASEESFTGKTTATLKALIGYEEWSNGTEFSCTVEHTDLPQPKQTTFTRENGKEHKRPSVYLLAPPEHKKGETMTLTCYVKDFYPKEVFVSWLADDEPVNLKSKTSPPMETDKYFSVYSQITVLSDKWKSGSVYSCVVYHETIDERMRVLTRSIADNTDKPAVINLIIRVTQPTIALLSREDDNSILLECQVKDYYPDKLVVQWLKGDQPVSAANNKMLQTTKGTTNFTYISQLSISAQYEDKQYTCKATHNSKDFTEEYSMCKAKSVFKPSIQVKIGRFIPEGSTISISCIVEAPKITAVSWLTDGVNKKETSIAKDLPNNIISNLTLSKDEWLKLKTIVCTAKHPCFPEENNKIQVGDMKKVPVVVIRRPSKKSAQLGSALLECVVKDLPSGEVCINFQANNVDISDFSCVDWTPSENIWSLTTHFAIPSEHQKKGNTFTCKVHRPFKSWSSEPTGNMFDDPTIELVVVSSVGRSSSEPQKLLCSGKGFDPKIKWFSESTEKASTALVTKMDDGHVKVHSEILVPQQMWNQGVTYTCKIEDGQSGKTAVKNTSICAVIAPSSQQAEVYLLRSSLNHVRSDTFDLTCLVVVQSVKYFTIQWKVNGNVRNQNSFEQIDHANGTQISKSILKVQFESWDKYALFTCEVKHLCSNVTQQQNISKTRDPRKPTVRIFKPSDSDLSALQNTSLVCFITGFFPSVISVVWNLNKMQLDSSHYTDSSVVAHTSGGFSMYSALKLPASHGKDDVYSCTVYHESSQSPFVATLRNLCASLVHSAPSVKLLQGDSELVCLAYGFSPHAINITWLRGMTEVFAHNDSNPAKGPDGKFRVQSHLHLPSSDWAPGEVYRCRVTHVTGTQLLNISKKTAIFEEAIFMNENKAEFIAQDTVEEAWNMACAFLTLFLLSLLYGCIVTLVKVKPA